MNIIYLNESSLKIIEEFLSKNSVNSMSKEELIKEFKKIAKKYNYKIYNTKNYIYFHFDQTSFSGGIALYKSEMTLYIIQGQDFDPRLNPSQNIKIGAMYSFINNVKKIKKGIPITSSIFKKDRKIKLNEKRLKEIENILKHI
jgi:hypothetical protein